MPIDWQPLLKIIDAHQRFVITSHVRPDADALGSEIGLAAFLEARGKSVRIINDSPTPRNLAFLDPGSRVLELGRGVSADSAADTDVLIVVDTSAWQQLQGMADVLKKSPAQRVVIDHHLSSDDLSAAEFKDVSAAATGVLMTELIEHAGGRFEFDQAQALFAAMATDTGWYRFPNADSRTYRTASRLIDQGVKPHLVYSQLYEHSSLSRLKLHSIALGRVTLDCQGRLAHTLVTRQDFLETGSQPSETEELVNSGLTIDGVIASFLLVEQPDGRIKASLRSRSELSVAAIAEQFGGGGHRQAAGVMLPGPILEAQRILLTAFEKSMEHLLP